MTSPVGVPIRQTYSAIDPSSLFEFDYWTTGRGDIHSTAYRLISPAQPYCIASSRRGLRHLQSAAGASHSPFEPAVVQRLSDAVVSESGFGSEATHRVGEPRHRGSP